MNERVSGGQQFRPSGEDKDELKNLTSFLRINSVKRGNYSEENVIIY